MKKYSANFELQDKMRFSKASREIIEKRQRQMSEFMEYRKRATEKYEAEKEERIKLRGCDTENPTANENEEEEIVEFLIKKETIEAE